jgi:transposase
MRSSITSRMRAAGAAARSRAGSGARSGGSVATRSPSCRRSALSGRRIARTSCGVGSVWRGTSARLPDGIADCAFGPRLQAAFVTLTARHRVSRRGIVELAADLFGVTLSTGAVDAICQRASDALAGPHLQLQDWVLDQDAVHVDETGWRTRGEGRALWTATTPDAGFFVIAEHCNREQFNALVGTHYPGIVISDRWNGYSHLDPHQRQVC